MATTTYSPYLSKENPSKRHHRTATPEQRQIRSIMKAPVYTIGIDPQADRGLLYDFFEGIQSWANDFTVHLCTLNAAQIHAIPAHPAIVHCLGQSPQLAMLMTEKDILPAIVAAIISRFITSRTMDENALLSSGHPHSSITSQLGQLWHQLLPTDYQAKMTLLLAQRDSYTSIKNSPDHNSWRSNCAQKFADELIRILSTLLNPHLPPYALRHRTHVLQDLFVKGYRINFRLRMAPVRWQMEWPLAGAVFDSALMVNASRMLYGDAVRTMVEVGKREGEHGVVFAASPVVRKREVEGGVERVEVVHKGVVHIRRRWV